MRKLLIFIFFISNFVHANDIDHESIYLEFENAYFSNDVSKLSPWLHDDYSIEQSMNVPGMGSDSRVVTKAQLLSVLKSISKPSTMPRSKNVEIEFINENEFCGLSKTINETLVAGNKYEEKESRNVCFIKKGNSYQAKMHKIDVFYKAL